MAEASVTTKTITTNPPPAKGGKDSIDQLPGLPPNPIAEALGIPLPPSDDEVKAHQMSGYLATAQHGREPFESAEDFQARQAKQVEEAEQQQKDAEKETKKLMDTKRKQEEAAAKK